MEISTLRITCLRKWKIIQKKDLVIFFGFFRDIRPEIRKICISEMGQWMNKYSQYFLDENYLKYFGWTLYDKVRDVFIFFDFLNTQVLFAWRLYPLSDRQKCTFGKEYLVQCLGLSR